MICREHRPHGHTFSLGTQPPIWDETNVQTLTIRVRLLFKFVLKIFYGTIVVENANLIPANGRPW